MVTWEITNIHFMAYFDTLFRIDKLAQLLARDFVINYHPDEFPGLVIYHDKFSIIIFHRGIIKVTGIKKVEDITSAITEIKEMLKKYGVTLPEKYLIKIANISISGKFDCNNIDIERMSYELDEAFYDPDSFPAVRVYYKISDNYKVPFNIFKNGSFVSTGLKGEFPAINQYIENIVNSFQENVVKKFCNKPKV